MKITPEKVKAVYRMLLLFEPFSRWSLPPAERLVFVVVPYKSEWGEYNPEKKTLRISSAKVSTFLSLVCAVAHEMVHVRQDVAGRWPVGEAHNSDFKRMTRQICKEFEFLDPHNF